MQAKIFHFTEKLSCDWLRYSKQEIDLPNIMSVIGGLTQSRLGNFN